MHPAFGYAAAGRNGRKRLCGRKSFKRSLAAAVRFKKRESPLSWGLTGDFYAKIMLKSVKIYIKTGQFTGLLPL